MSVDELRELEDPETAAREAGLRYVSDDEPGLYRHRRGKGWSYHRFDGELITDPDEKARLNALVIPPAWSDVWICPEPDCHIQATGRDEKGRKQYRYHADWRAVRDVSKYARMVPFGRALPKIRRTVSRHLRKEHLPREKVLAAVVRLLERSLIRVGNDQYAEENESYGLTSMRDKHVEFHGSEVRFTFRGKGGKPTEVGIDDARLTEVVRQCRDVTGYELFQYFDDTGKRHEVDSGDVNEYLRDISGEDFTAKDFRTWAGTVYAATELQACGPAENEREAASRVGTAIEKVAERLGNTPAVCRACYIYPVVIDLYTVGTLEEALYPPASIPREKVRGLSNEEVAVLALLESTLEQALKA